MNVRLIKEIIIAADTEIVTILGGFAMYTQSLSPSFSLPQSFLTDIDSNKHDSHKQEKVDDNYKRGGRLANDSYHPGKRLENTSSKVVSSEVALKSTATRVSHSADIQIKTKQGDIVTISLNQSATNSSSTLQAEQGNSKVIAYSESNSVESGFSISIEGDLNKEEQKSLTELINKMSKVSDKFFNGNVKSAFKHAQKMGFDTEQIASFSMDLRKEKSVQAVAAYQQTTVPEQNINTDLLKQAGDFLAQAKASMADTHSKLNSLTNQSFTDLFAGVGEMNMIAQDKVEESREPLFLQMIRNISEGVFAK